MRTVPTNRARLDQHNDQTGEAAVDMLVGMLHNQEFGVPLHVGDRVV